MNNWIGIFAGLFFLLLAESVFSEEEPYRETRAPSSLTLDGNLDEPLWKNAQKLSPFYLYKSDNRLASVRTTVFFTHDDRYLYFGFVCDEPKTDALRKSVTTQGNIGSVYLDDCVEVMVDGDKNKWNYYHIIVNPLGCYGVELRTDFGQLEAPVSNFQVFTGTRIEKDRWVVELAIPYSSFVEERIKSEIAFNCARDRRVNLAKAEESSLARQGQFHQPDLFTTARLTGTDVSRYAFTISPPMVRETTYKNGRIEAKLSFQVTNLTDSARELILSAGDEKLGRLPSLPVWLAGRKNKEATFTFPIPRADTYRINLAAWDRKDKEAVLYNGTFPVKISFAPITLDVVKPFYRNNIYATENINEIQASCLIGLKEEQYTNGKIVLSLNDITNRKIASKTFPIPQGEMLLSLRIPKLADGKYRLVARLLKANNLVAEQTVVITKLPPAKGNEVRIDENLEMVLNGKPILPIVWWGGSPFKWIAETGADGVVFGFSFENRPMLDQMKANNLYSAVLLPDAVAEGTRTFIGSSTLSKEAKEHITNSVNSLKDHPATLYYCLIDEPEMAGVDPRILEEGYNLVRELDPYHPIMITNNRVHGIHTYKDALDMFFPDPYVSPKIDGTIGNLMTYVSDFMEASKRAGGGRKLIGLTSQVFNYGDYGAGTDQRAPTFTEERCMQYLGIIHGAKGFSYFISANAVKYPDLRVGAPYLIKEIKSLSPIILTGQEIKETRVSVPDIHLLLKKEGKCLYLFACNVTDKPLKVEVTLPVDAGEMKVISEGRNVKAAKKEFSDLFGPYAVHIYTTNLAIQDVVSLNKIKKAVLKAGGIFEFKYR